MHVFTRRNALIGWIVLRLLRRRLTRRLHNARAMLTRRRLLAGTGLAGSAAVVAVVARRPADTDDTRSV